MMVKSVILATAAAFWGIAIMGCNATHEKVDPQGLYNTMLEKLAKSGKVEDYQIQTPLNLDDYPILKEACEDVFNQPNYIYNGDKMRIKINKHGYNMDTEAVLYRHQYGLCFDFYPVEEGKTQEAVYVQYFGTIRSSAKDMVKMITKVAGGFEALLQDSGFHMTNLNVAENGWPAVNRENYNTETKKVQYLKMDPVEMNAINKYDADKFKDFMGFEFVHVFITRVNGQIKVSEVKTAAIHHILKPKST